MTPPSGELSPLAIRTIMAGLLADDDKFHRWWPMVGPGFFVDPYYNRIAEFVDLFYKKYGKPPDFEVVQDKFKTDPGLSSDERDMCLRVIDDVLAAPVEHWAYYEEHLALFVRKQAFLDAHEKAEILIERGDFEGTLKLLAEANSAGVTRDSGTTDFFLTPSIEARFDRRTDPKAVVKRVALQMGNTDTHMRGGLKPKTLTVFVAVTGGGKTTALVHFGRVAVLQGQKVLHITLELETTDIVDKYDSSFTGIKYDDLEKDAGKVRGDFLSKFSKYGDALRIIERPEYSLTPQDLESFLLILQREGKFFPDVLLVDYADLMTGGKQFTRGGQDRRFELNFIYTWLHRIAKTFNLIVVTATQANRGAMGKNIIMLEDIAEDISKSWIADHILAVCQTVKERLDGKCRLFLAKNRWGRAFVEVTFNQDLAKCTFAVPSPFASSRILSSEEAGKSVVIGEESST